MIIIATMLMIMGLMIMFGPGSEGGGGFDGF